MSIKSIITVSTVVLCLPAMSNAEGAEELFKARKKYEQKVDEAMAPINKSYIAHLTKLKAELIAEDDLEGALAAKREIERIEGRRSDLARKSIEKPSMILPNKKLPLQQLGASWEKMSFSDDQWININADSDWVLSGDKITRESNRQISWLEYGKGIPCPFQFRFKIEFLGLGPTDGKHICFTGAQGNSYTLLFGDTLGGGDMPFGIGHDGQVLVVDSDFDVQMDKSYAVECSVSEDMFYVEVAGKSYSTKIDLTYPVKMTLKAQRTGFEISELFVKIASDI